jgi:squalene/oxidosqualene cyclase-like protein
MSLAKDVAPLREVTEEGAGLWTLEVDEGRQVWKYIAREEAIKLNRTVEEHVLSKKSNDPGCTYENASPVFPSPAASAEAAAKFYATIQTADGHWSGDYGGPMFLLPGLVFTSYITDTPLKAPHVREILRYLKNRADPTDGGWGLHIESPSTVFGTALNYVAARLLGASAEEEWMQRARRCLLALGGAEYIPSWGKFWLATLGLYSWSGLDPLPPEMWYLPSSLPFHPSKYWCHCRVVYLPMAFIYGGKYTAKNTPLLDAIRAELYTKPYKSVDWPSCRAKCAAPDMYRPHSRFLRFVQGILACYESIHSKTVRSKALAFTLDHIKHEDETTRWIDIGPVNKVMNMLSVWFAEGKSEHFQKHCDRLYDYLWLSDDGMKMQGYNGSQLWDTAFAVQAIIDAGVAKAVPECVRLAYDYMEVTQVPEDVDEKEKYYRHISKGAWPFSTRDHGWPISDCTAEGLKAVLAVHDKHPELIGATKINKERLYDAINVSLSLQNKDGGWATYENTRGPEWLEWLNPSEVYGEIMIDYSYVECTSASVQALCSFRKQYPMHRTKEVNESIKRGVEFIKKIQRPDGGWYGSWAVCFTYGTWFGILGLVAAGETYATSEAIRKGCAFLKGKQMADGGWGETYMSCRTFEYVHNNRSQVFNTSWAVLALMAAGYDQVEGGMDMIRRGVDVLMRRQMPNGDFPQERCAGIFNRSACICYSNYRNIFPLWAIGTFSRKYGSRAKL